MKGSEVGRAGMGRADRGREKNPLLLGVSLCVCVCE